MVLVNGTNALVQPAMHSLEVVRTTNSATSNSALLKQLEVFDSKWLRVFWLDFTSTSRCRLIPMRRVLSIIEHGGPLVVSITMASLGLLQNDTMIPEITGTGTYNAHPDWESLRWGPVQGHSTVFLDFKAPDGAEVALCPRTLLRNAVKTAGAQNISLLLGFELEFVILASCDGSQADKIPREGHGWSSARAIADVGRDGSFNSILDELLDGLTRASVKFEQFHTESAPGQYEIVLPPLPPLEACDTLLRTRNIVEAVAARNGFHMTLHPKPFSSSTGSASHVHMSISSPGGDNPDVYEPFYAGILRHYPALISLTYPNPTSYERMVDSFWAGGRWVTWGTQNKEAPLRKCEDSHWEMKTFDGLANPYMAMAGIIAAGTHGTITQEPLIWQDCTVDPAKLSLQERKDLGITVRFPENLKTALDELNADKDLAEMLGLDFVKRYTDVKKGEMRILDPMDEEERRQWTLQKY